MSIIYPAAAATAALLLASALALLTGRVCRIVIATWERCEADYRKEMWRRNVLAAWRRG